MNNFNRLMARSNEVAINAMGDDDVWINGVSVAASVEQQAVSPMVTVGGKNEGTEFVLYVKAYDFQLTGATKQSVVKWGNLTSRIQKISPARDGTVMVECGPFNPGRVPGL